MAYLTGALDYAAHDEPSLYRYGVGSCESEHFYASFFGQAVWEVLHDVDAAVADCATRADVLEANSIGWGSKREAAIWMAHVLSYAIDTSGAGKTFSQFANKAWIYFHPYHSDEVGVAVRQVFPQHSLPI